MTPLEIAVSPPVTGEVVPAVRGSMLRELVAVGSLVVLADLTLFRGYGYAGAALLLALAPVLLWMARPRPGGLAIAVMLWLLAARSIWLGSPLGMVFGVVLIVAFSMQQQGIRPYVPTGILYAVHLTVAAFGSLRHYASAIRHNGPRLPRIAWLNFGLPLVALVLFGGLFVLANPHLVTALTTNVESWQAWLSSQLGQFQVDRLEVFFCLAMAWLAIGLVRPLLRPEEVIAGLTPIKPIATSQPAPLYGAVRNTLLAVIGLFGVYLVFEFGTLWFRKFPAGFHYSGYAHQGAAWLTAALALATLVLSLLFRGDLLRDPRLPQLKRLAWIWSAQNLLLAATVYNRMHIYIDFNGMTRMRMIGLFGITSVVVGFGLVIWKIAKGRDFAWLVQRQLWTVTLAAFVFALTPVDAIVHGYNVRRILAGDPAPAVQISVHPMNAEGVLMLSPLVNATDSTIREGICAMLAERAMAAEELAERRGQEGWTSLQLADRALLAELRATQEHWQPYLNAERRADALKHFHRYAYQWY